MERTLRTLGLSTVAIVAIACGGAQFSMHGVDRAAGADAHVEIEAQDTGNYSVTAEATNLLPPARFGDGLTVFVVWFQQPDTRPQRMGALAYDEGDRTGRMMATTPHGEFTFLVTGEATADPVSPSTHVVFRMAVAAR